MAKTLRTMKHLNLSKPTWLPSLAPSLQKHYWANSPREMCGIVQRLKDGSFHFTLFENKTDQNPHTCFQIDPIQVLQCCEQSVQEGIQMCAWIHSHPGGSSRASLADSAFWWADRTWLWPRMDQVIIWPKSSKDLNLSVYGPQTNIERPIPRWQGPLNRKNSRITVDRSGAMEHTIC